MKKTTVTGWLASGVLLLACAPTAIAHHSASMFDFRKTETYEATVKKYQWTNPHGWLFLSVKNAEGAEVEYGVELTSPNLLMRRGWRPTTFQVGDKVTVITNPMRDGSPSGRVVSVTKADGSVWTER